MAEPSPESEDWALLEKLQGRFCSSTWGLVQVRRKENGEPGQAKGRKKAPCRARAVLEVWEEERRCRVGFVRLVKGDLPRIQLACTPSGSCEAPGVWSLDPECSTTDHVRWVPDQPAKKGGTEIWDGAFLKSIEKAALWVIQHGLLPQLDEAWRYLRDVKAVRRSLPYTVGLCTATMNRFWQIRRALPLTLMHAWPYRGSCKVHVVDLGSKDNNTFSFLVNSCRFAMEAGLLCVYRAKEEFWHASVGKNTAHRVADEDILVNVDSDNLIGAEFLQDLPP